MQPDWDSPEVAKATRASLGGCLTWALITFAVLIVFAYLLAFVLELF